MKTQSITFDDFVEDISTRRHQNYYSWGIKEIDDKCGLMTLGRIFILGGPHGVGKTTWLTELAKSNASTKKTMIIPLEMGISFTLITLTCNLYNHRRENDMKFLQYGDVEEGFLFERDTNEQKLFYQCAKDLFDEYPNLYIDLPKTDILKEDSPPPDSLEGLVEFISKTSIDYKIKFFVIDHLHQLNSTSSDETAFYSSVAKTLKTLAAELDITLLCIVQLTKAANSLQGQLDLSAFKGTSEFTSNAHKVALIRKPFYNPMKPAEVKSFLKNNEIISHPNSMDVERFLSEDEQVYKEKSRPFREIVFLKTRGRQEGTFTIKLEKGEFEFVNHGSYNPCNVE